MARKLTIPNRENSLFRTNMRTSEIFKSQAETEYEKRKKKEAKELLEEINRRTMEGKYNI